MFNSKAMLFYTNKLYLSIKKLKNNQNVDNGKKIRSVYFGEVKEG